MNHRLHHIENSSLGELCCNKITVPNGFALSIKVFEEFLQYNSFSFTKTEYIKHNDEIKAFLLSGNFSDETLSILKKNYVVLSMNRQNAKFVVRSSAICEDSKNYSMAGMFISYTNLGSFKDIVETIENCYASLFQDKVLSFMINNNVSMDELKMGVIIQEFIEGEMSGVNFSADVLDMNSNVICINIVEGVCEKYVSGEASSSLYKIDKQTGEKRFQALLQKDLLDLLTRSLGLFFKRLWTAVLGLFTISSDSSCKCPKDSKYYH